MKFPNSRIELKGHRPEAPPYIHITPRLDRNQIVVEIETGGGIQFTDQTVIFLLNIVELHTNTDATPYLDRIDATRAANNQAPIEDTRPNNPYTKRS